MQDQATTTDLTTLPPAERAAVALGSSKTETTLRELAQKSAAITVVVDLPGRDEAHRAGMELKHARTAISKTGKAARDDANAFCAAVIAEEKRLIGIVEPEEKRVLGLRDAFDAKLAAEKAERERIEAERIAAIKAKIDLIRQLPAASLNDSAAELRGTLDDLLTIVPAEAEYAEFTQDAAQVIADVREALSQLWSAAAAREAEAERLAAERAELERLQAEQAERERIAREQREQEEARLAEERAAFEAERAAFAAQKAEAEQAEQERIAREAAVQQAGEDALRPATVEQPALALAEVAAAALPEPLANMIQGADAEQNDNAALVPVDAYFVDDSEQVAQFAKAVRELFNTRSPAEIRGMLENELAAIEAGLKEVA